MLLSLSDNVCKSHDALCAIWFNGAIRIEHAITDDLPDGTPVLPGFIGRRDFLGACRAAS